MASTRKASRKNRDSRKNRKTRKQAGGKRGGSDWAKSVKRVYEEMKRKDRSTKLGDAMKEASRRRKNGTL
jgi:hypothetical protein